MSGGLGILILYLSDISHRSMPQEESYRVHSHCTHAHLSCVSAAGSRLSRRGCIEIRTKLRIGHMIA